MCFMSCVYWKVCVCVCVLCMCVSTFLCLCVYLNMFVHVFVCVCVCVPIILYVHFVSMSVCLWVKMRLHVPVYIWSGVGNIIARCQPTWLVFGIPPLKNMVNIFKAHISADAMKNKFPELIYIIPTNTSQVGLHFKISSSDWAHYSSITSPLKRTQESSIFSDTCL